MMWIAVLTGLRWGEVAGLRVGSVDLLRGELQVVEQRTRDLPGEDVNDEPKSRAGVRPLGIEAELIEMISSHLAARGPTGAEADTLVFVADRGGPLNYSHWRQRIWNPACLRAGLAGLTFHDLRRCNATGMVADNVDVKTAMTRFGHSDVRLHDRAVRPSHHRSRSTGGRTARCPIPPARSTARWLRSRFNPSPCAKGLTSGFLGREGGI